MYQNMIVRKSVCPSLKMVTKSNTRLYYTHIRDNSKPPASMLERYKDLCFVCFYFYYSTY